MWQVISNIASLVSIISAIVAFYTSVKIKSYYKKITTAYSLEKITIAEQDSIEAKDKYQNLKKLYIERRGALPQKYRSIYIEIEDLLDKIKHFLPTECEEGIKLIKETKVLINKLIDDESVNKNDLSFIDLGRYLDDICDYLKSQKSRIHGENAKNIGSA